MMPISELDEVTPQSLLALCPWLRSVPNQLLERLTWQRQATDYFPHQDILLLYVGPPGQDALDSVLHTMDPTMMQRTVASDIVRPEVHHPQDIMNDDLYSHLCHKALKKEWSFIGGGPNCRTWSILRWFPKPGAPTPVRGREANLVWGLPTNSLEEQMDTDRDSLLLLRQMVLTSLAQRPGEHPRKVHSFLEHPQDPMECSSSPQAPKCSTIWATEAYADWGQQVGHSKISFDQCELGQLVKKSTTLSTTLTLHHWQGLRCSHAQHELPKDMASKDLSRYPWDMMSGIAKALLECLNPPSAHSSTQNQGEPPGRTDRVSSVPLSRAMTTMDDPVLVQSGFKIRPLRDGGGKPSPGRRPPPSRPQSRLQALGHQLRRLVLPKVPTIMASIHRRDREQPLEPTFLQQLRHVMASFVGLPLHEAEEVEKGQPFHLNLIHSIAGMAEDVDAEYPLQVKQGVPLGVNSPTWTSPGVWPTKDELKGESPEWEDLGEPSGRENYPSAKDFTSEVRRTFVEEVELGMVQGPYTKTQAAEVCGCHPEELCPGPLAAIDEGDKIRTIYDGSWGGANAKIQQNTVEKTTAPTVMDCVQAIHWLKHTQQNPNQPVAHGAVPGWDPPGPTTTWSMLKADVTKAHRRIKILADEWRFQVAQLDNEWWVNTVGTYGMASAQLYWGRMAALLLRLCYATFPQVDWGFVFVDDFCWLLRTTTAPESAGLLLSFLLALGCPLSWKKTALSEINTWLGFQVNPRGPIIDFEADKRSTLGALLEKLRDGHTFSSKDIEKALGRLNWASAAWPLSRPFLQPFWAWKAATTTMGRPSHLIRSFAKLLLHLLHNPQIQPCPYDPLSDWWGASDASATKLGEAYIGGWIACKENPSKADTWWFHYKVPLEDHPWAHQEGDPTRRIAALEMFGTLILTYFLLQRGGKTLLRTRLSLISDNQGNIFAMLNQKTKKMPTSAILMQLVVLLHSSGTQLAPSHMKRDFNQWADELTHPHFSGFLPERQLLVSEAFSSFNLLWSMLSPEQSRPPLKRCKTHST